MLMLNVGWPPIVLIGWPPAPSSTYSSPSLTSSRFKGAALGGAQEQSPNEVALLAAHQYRQENERPVTSTVLPFLALDDVKDDCVENASP